MQIFGSGPPLILVPGVQGRWEWMAPTVQALARSFRVAVFSLCGEPGSPPLNGHFDVHLEQVDEAVQALGGAPTIVVGVSFGGWVAVRYAAERPERVRALVLVSTPGPGYQPHAQHARWIRSPRRSFPAFVLTTPGRLFPEVWAAMPAPRDRWEFLWRHVRSAIVAPMSATRAASRVQLGLRLDITEVARRVQAPTLVVHGDDELDRLVPPASTRRYADVIRDARIEHLERTGHIGTVTRPDRFADLVRVFVGTREGMQCP